jgi:hypothetical protein
MNFGDAIPADYVSADSEEPQGLLGERKAVIIGDRATQWIYEYPVKTQSGDDTHKAVRQVLVDW